MSRWDIYVLCLCAVLCAGELLGPDSKKDPEKSSEDDEEILDTIDTNAQVNPEYLKQLTEAVNKEMLNLQEYADAVKKSRGLVSEDQPKTDESTPDNHLEQMEYTLKLLRKSLLRQTPMDDFPEMKGEPLQKYDENPQDLLDSLPSIPEDVVPELSPELKEAKELYDVAMAKLNRRSPELRAAILQIKQAAERGYVPAKIKLAWSYLFGEGVELDIEKAKAIFEELVVEGNGDAHAGMGFLYATGIGVPVSQAKALVHYTLGSLGDSDYAQMSLAYRHWAGITVPASCPKAMDIYMKVAAKVASKVTLSGGPAMMRTRLIDEAESGSGGALDTDLIEYYQLLAEK
ncbi:hypothetical protein O0L34_g13007 [Tuta absoluta]|nr:hypothetical protein O0L34_g13007 [Tuta absoluta]